MHRLALALPLCLTIALPALGQGQNLSASQGQDEPGTAAQLMVAQRAYLHALRQGDVLALLASIRLARGVTLRPASGWERIGEAAAEVEGGIPASVPDPAGEYAILIARNLAGDDPDLQDIVYDLDAQLPRGRLATAVAVEGVLQPGETAVWRLALFGEVAAEVALIGDGQARLGLSLADESGAQLCTHAPTPDPVLCRIVPARNGFFTLSVSNPGATAAAFRLFGN